MPMNNWILLCFPELFRYAGSNGALDSCGSTLKLFARFTVPLKYTTKLRYSIGGHGLLLFPGTTNNKVENSKEGLFPKDHKSQYSQSYKFTRIFLITHTKHMIYNHHKPMKRAQSGHLSLHINQRKTFQKWYPKFYKRKQKLLYPGRAFLRALG